MGWRRLFAGGRRGEGSGPPLVFVEKVVRDREGIGVEEGRGRDARLDPAGDDGGRGRDERLDPAGDEGGRGRDERLDPTGEDQNRSGGEE